MALHRHRIGGRKQDGAPHPRHGEGAKEQFTGDGVVAHGVKMGQQQVTAQVVCPKPTDTQIQAQIENLRWSEKQQEQQTLWQQQYQQHQQQYSEHQAAVTHDEFMVEHLGLPGAGVCVSIVAAFVIVKLGLASHAASVQKNKDDNESDVRYAQRIIDKHEASE